MAPMTPEQLEFFSNQTDRAVHMTARRIARRASVGFIILLFGLGGQYYVGQQDLVKRRQAAQQQRAAIVHTGNAVAVSGCNRDFKSTKALRALLLSAQSQLKGAFKRGDITTSQYSHARTFYEKQLDLLTLPDCRPVARLISADPNRPIVVPAPLYEKP